MRNRTYTLERIVGNDPSSTRCSVLLDGEYIGTALSQTDAATLIERHREVCRKARIKDRQVAEHLRRTWTALSMHKQGYYIMHSWCDYSSPRYMAFDGKQCIATFEDRDDALQCIDQYHAYKEQSREHS